MQEVNDLKMKEGQRQWVCPMEDWSRLGHWPSAARGCAAWINVSWYITRAFKGNRVLKPVSGLAEGTLSPRTELACLPVLMLVQPMVMHNSFMLPTALMSTAVHRAVQTVRGVTTMTGGQPSWASGTRAYTLSIGPEARSDRYRNDRGRCRSSRNEGPTHEG